MGTIGVQRKYIFETEGGWSDARKFPLCLDTGSWRTERPELKEGKCKRCGTCALFCPPQCINEKEDYFKANLDYCKGCGICAKECPAGAIAMVPEGEGR